MIQRILRGIRHPYKAYNQLYALTVWKVRWKAKEILLWDYYYSALREPKVTGAVQMDSGILDEVAQQLRRSNFNLVDYQIDEAEYKLWVSEARYERFSHYFGGGIARYLGAKKLQHYLAAKLLELKKDDIYADIASGDSPAPQIYHDMFQCQVYRQDLSYPAGSHGNKIGGDAGNMPVSDGSFTKMALHCSFEMFEQDSDIRFIKEASRVLRHGGRLCVLPLFLFPKYAISIDPCVLPRGAMRFESDAILYCAKGSGYGPVRYYDVPHLLTRIENNFHDLKLTIYLLQNGSRIEPSCDTNFMALFEKVSNV
jgi:SAM-dependent methyltransferase